MSLNPICRDWRGRHVWVIGASSGIGRATASALHARGAHVIVSARNRVALEAFTQQHPGSTALPLDVTHATRLEQCAAQLHTQGQLDWVLYCAGHYSPMQANAIDLGDMLQHNAINLQGAQHMLAAVVPKLLERVRTVASALIHTADNHPPPHISLVGSVAGYQGLPLSLAYGPTKAALMHLAEVLYLDLHPQGIGVSLISPGFVETPLTAGNHFAMPALMRPEQAAQAILQGWAKGQFEVHFPRRFTWWLKLLRQLPYSVSLPLLQRYFAPKASPHEQHHTA
ncbi:SDR family NAD(P)-dependent oxidoreductase [Curvibacter sp. CHRR-16]|uniref:SDR family NAD(P)-dependent oxidoreductase n=1 Tax=Curvibacter sp. CHRR-16 TaxID=2835872 RepID=UPI001BDA8FB0|nr:SDR family NAD(P)-dependent oxidoreductase [Curvibacter sp. CHRR-16]MBT0569342.1 SDR family NAD(P)-dependent oxidoreductase [Curvibacter sp. CHRR-16]